MLACTCLLERGAFKQVRTKTLAELSQAERSEALPREARRAAEGGQHFDVPEPREVRQVKLEATKQRATQLPRPNADSSFPGSSAPPAKFIDVSGFINSFGLALFVVQGIGSVQVVVAARCSRKSIRERLGGVKVPRMMLI